MYGLALDFKALAPYLSDKKQNFMTQGSEFQPPYHHDWLVILMIWLAYIVMVMMISGCTTTRYVQVPVTHTDTLRLVHERHDSIWLHDSIYQREYMRGDTVYRYIDRWHNQYIKQLLRDTAYISRRDTVPVPYPVKKYIKVPAQLAWHQQARIWLANLVLVALAVAAAVWIVRKRSWWLGRIRKLL